MSKSLSDGLDARIRNAFSTWKKIDELDVKILQGLSLLGPRNLTPIAEMLGEPVTTIRYRVRRMLDKSILFLHMNPYHTYMGLKKAIIFVEATPGFEDALLDCLRVHDYWLLLSRIYGPYEGCAGIWTIPLHNAEEFEAHLMNLVELGVARSYEINWSTCFEGVPVQMEWFDTVSESWQFKWDEWINEVETIKGELPYTLVEPRDWPIKVDLVDLLIIKELEIDGRRTLTDIAKNIGVSLEKVKYHFREHVSKLGLIEGYQVEIYRAPAMVSESLFFKFEFDSHEKMKKFALSIHDKPFPFFLGKILGENALMTQMYLPNWEFRRFIAALSKIIKKGLLRDYHYVLQDKFQTWRETIPYQYFENNKWKYDIEQQQADLRETFKKWGIGGL